MSEPTAHGNGAASATQPPFDVFGAQRAVFQSGLSAREKIVALAVIHHMNAYGECWPSIGRLAKVASVARSTVSEALRRLTDDGWLERRRRVAADGDLDSTLYRWAGSPVAGLPSQRVTRTPVDGSPSTGQRVARQAGKGSPVAGQKHLKEQPRSNTQENMGEPTSLKVDQTWGIILEQYARHRKAAHGSAGLPDKVPKGEREEIAQFFIDAAEEARDMWPGAERSEPAEKWVRYVVDRVLCEWFAADGANDYLNVRAHPLSALRADLASAHAGFLDEFKAKAATAANQTARKPHAA